MACKGCGKKKAIEREGGFEQAKAAALKREQERQERLNPKK